MKEVAVTLRVMPESADVDLEELERRVRSVAGVRTVSKEPIAFGLVALRVVGTVPDAAGGSDPLEKALAGIPGVGSVQVIGVTLL